MGVTGLWPVVQPCARPIKLETLNKKRLAVDASIWIYQFLKAVRDKEGNALRNSHVVGFFRRICKLLFFGIKPVFVFDGGAPALKRQTISGRKARREGRAEDAVKTASKLLAVQMQRRAEEEEEKRRTRARRREDETSSRAPQEDEEALPEDLVYVDELQMTEKERRRNRRFRKTDAYHLPELDVSFADMGALNDPRIMSQHELEEYARQFHAGEDINLYDFSKIDFESPFFLSLPASDRYNILNAARLRSRLRMGYSKEQLDTMFPDRMAFSKFQIERVRERNELTQRLMNINGMNGEVFGAGRVAGEKGKEYVLVKNDGVEGGWALGVVSNKNDGDRNRPIDLERIGRDIGVRKDDDEWEDESFEDVPIEGLNRLPKLASGQVNIDHNEDYMAEGSTGLRRAIHEDDEKAAALRRSAHAPMVDADLGSLFLPHEQEGANEQEDRMDEFFEDVPPPTDHTDEEVELQRAIAMSLEDPDDREAPGLPEDIAAAVLNVPRIDVSLEFNSKNAQTGRAYATMTNARAKNAAPHPLRYGSDDDRNPELQAAIAESRKMDPRAERGSRNATPPSRPKPQPQHLPSTSKTQESGFSGPLPFESIDLGKSLFTKNKKGPPIEGEGGFEKESEERAAKPLPPWFSGDVRKDTAAQRATIDQQFDGGIPMNTPSFKGNPFLHRQRTSEVIDLDASPVSNGELVEVESSDDEMQEAEREGGTRPVDREIYMDDIADLAGAEPPTKETPIKEAKPSAPKASPVQLPDQRSQEPEEEELIDWEESDRERRAKSTLTGVGELQTRSTRSPSPDFENLDIPPAVSGGGLSRGRRNADEPAVSTSSKRDDTFDEFSAADIPPEDPDPFSDPEDEELMRQLAVEAEEHARFASSLNAKSQVQNAEDYERELKQLRSQQKRDRRDADEVSHIMVTECQQLLKLFGLPYITAPMEAEAQCAELVSLGLVDGIVTDDSDIFLFGGTRVYKNMFNQAKFVECYLSADLEKEYALSRARFIQIAHLLGSDYTEGIPGIGPVTALEILSEFGDLDAFRDWWTKVQTGAADPGGAGGDSPFRRKFRRNAARLFLPPTFPDRRVDLAYLHPEVDGDPSPFAWGVPDLDALRQFLMATVGWSQERADEILVPVIRDMNRREAEGTQANITQFFGGTVGVGAIPAGARAGAGGGAFAPRRRAQGKKSKRLENALGKLNAQAKGKMGAGRGEDDDDDDDDDEVGSAATPKKRRPRKNAKPREVEEKEDREHDHRKEDDDDDDDAHEAPRRAPKRRKRTARAPKT